MTCADPLCRSHRPGGTCDCPPPRLKHHVIGGASDYVIVDTGALARGEYAIQLVQPGPYLTKRTNYGRIEFRSPVTIEQFSSPQQDGTRIRITNLGLMEVFA